MVTLRFDHRDFVLLGDGTYRWLDIKCFTFPRADDCDGVAIVDAIIHDRHYRDHYALPDSHETDSETLHGPFLVAKICADDFTPISATGFSDVVRQFLDLDGASPVKGKQLEIDAVLSQLLTNNAVHFQLTKALDADIYEWGSVLWEFRELISIDCKLGTAALCVMAID